MFSLGTLAFANAWLLLALAVLPVLWWLLRVTPPAPRVLRFPAVRLLFRLRQEEETPAHTPLWLLLLRLLLATLIILGLAHPLLNPREALPGSGPMLLVVDNDWASARHWDDRRQAMEGLIDQAERNNRQIILLTTAPSASGEPIQASNLMPASEARRVTQAIEPVPWPADHAAALKALDELNAEGSINAVWLASSVTLPDHNEAAVALASTLQQMGSVRIFGGAPQELPRLILPPKVEAGGLDVKLRRAHDVGRELVTIVAAESDGRPVARVDLNIDDGQSAASVLIKLPSELRNRVERLTLQNETTAGATVLLDERWRRRPTGIISGTTLEKEQPLLSDHYYLDRALGPISEVRQGSVGDLLERELAILVFADAAPETASEMEAVENWIEAGGIAVRFAGPILAAEADIDELVPVKLRRGDRTFGGAMSWTRPARLAPFEETSPFAGLAVPRDVVVTRQVLAEPAADLAEKTWVRLEDGTPLVTAEARGQGWLVLFHTTANTEWSNLAISGLFVEMMQRLLTMGKGVLGDGGDRTLPPLETLDGFGRLTAPPATTRGVRENDFADTRPGPGTPPGYYGADSLRRALNLSPFVTDFSQVSGLPSGVIEDSYGQPGEVDLRPWFLTGALFLALIDILIGLALRGLIGLRAVPGSAAGILLVLMLGQPAEAQSTGDSADRFATAATTATRLAYVLTGDSAVDEISRAGLAGLSDILRQRTAVEPGSPVGVDVESGELAFFPLLYWPMTPDQRSLSPEANKRISGYLRRGGMILFDTRDRNVGGGNAGSLRNLVRGLSIPSLEPVPPNHVLTKAFYLIQRFPGRWDGGEVWVERLGRNINDGVSAVVIGGNDWASAWAVDASGRPMFPAVPGGEAQREQAYRFGVNVVMYALTGNYKADQVHVPTILRRLGQ